MRFGNVLSLPLDPYLWINGYIYTSLIDFCDFLWIPLSDNIAYSIL